MTQVAKEAGKANGPAVELDGKGSPIKPSLKKTSQKNEGVQDKSEAETVRRKNGTLTKKPSVYWGSLDTRNLAGQIRTANTARNIEMGVKTNTVEASRDSLQSSHGRKSVLAVPGQVDQEGDKLSLGTRRDSTFLSLDSLSRHSVDYRIPNPTTVPVINNEEEKPKSLMQADDALIREAIPCLPLGLAASCLVLNVVLPGFGTILSGFSIFCCGKTRVPTKDDHVIVTFCVNVWVGVAQFFTVPLFLVGWFWSVAWGIKLVIHANEYRKEQKIQRDKDLQQLALSAFGSPNRARMFPA